MAPQSLATTVFSAKLSPTQHRYSTFDRELLAGYSALLHFHAHLYGCPFQLHIDHRPLVSALHCLSPPKSDRQQCLLGFISEFAVTALHTPGSDNHVADAFFWPPSLSPLVQLVAAVSATSSPPFSSLQLAQQQAQCHDTLRLRTPFTQHKVLCLLHYA